jgi:Ser/Thr protein kinase RdoA (MazF antagonist)
MDEVETPLHGGRVTAGVVRVGDTVRRPIKGDRTLQHALLTHLEQKGFVGTPRFLGVDALGREILSLLPGEVPRELGHYVDTQLAAAAGLLRRFHNATTDFPLVRESDAEVMCHNDWGPCNTVFRGDTPVGIIDFDTIAPGLRLWDLGYAMWLWLDIGNACYVAAEQVRRMSMFVAGYGDPRLSVDRVVPFVLARQATLAAWARARAQNELAAWATLSADWTVANVVRRLQPGAFPE